MPKYLSKSKFLSGSQCHKKLWLEVNRRDLATPVSAAQEWIFEQGNQIGHLATQQFPDGVEVDHSDFFGAVRETQKLMETDVPAIFEATFRVGRLYARVDVLRRTPYGWDLIEVKGSTRAKPVHIIDIAFQYHLLKKAGVIVTGLYLMHVNRDYIQPDDGDFLVIEEVGKEVEAVLPAVVTELKGLLGVMDRDEPDVPIGTHCSDPYDCPFQEHCWSFLPTESVLTIPSLKKVKAFEMVHAGIHNACDVPEDTHLSDKQRAYVNRLRTGEVDFDMSGIESMLAELTPPYYFLDFETDNPALPRADGLSPYAKMPYQYSCHIVDSNGDMRHVEYLHDDLSDPHSVLASRLVNDLGESGSIIAYNAGFEQGVIRDLAGRAPSLSAELLVLNDRFWDLLVLVRKYIEHPGFLGSKSIKNVLPVLVPGFSYEGMVVANGSDAGGWWNKMIRMQDGAAKEAIREDLLAYCRMDTLAMVKIWEVLRHPPDS